MAKQVYECNWVPSRVTETQLNNLILIGALGSKNTILGGSLAKNALPHLKKERSPFSQIT